MKYSTLLWLLELQVKSSRKVFTQVHTVNSNSRTAICQCSLCSKKNPIIRIFCIAGCLSVPLNPVKWSSAVKRGVIGFTPRQLFSPEENPPLSLRRMLRGPMVRSWTHRKFLTHAGNQKDLSVVQSVSLCKIQHKRNGTILV